MAEIISERIAPQGRSQRFSSLKPTWQQSSISPEARPKLLGAYSAQNWRYCFHFQHLLFRAVLTIYSQYILISSSGVYVRSIIVLPAFII